MTQQLVTRAIYPNGQGRYHAIYPNVSIPNCVSRYGDSESADMTLNESAEGAKKDIEYSELADTGSILYINKVVIQILGVLVPGMGGAQLNIEPSDESDTFWHVLCEVSECEPSGQRTENFVPGTPMTDDQHLCFSSIWLPHVSGYSSYFSANTPKRAFRLHLEYTLG